MAGADVAETTEVVTSDFPMVVDYSRSTPAMVAAGRYDEVNPFLPQISYLPDDPLGGRKQIVGVVVHLGRPMTSSEVVKELDRLGLRPATMPELLAFGEQHPNAQLEHEIIAIDATWKHPDGDDRIGWLYELGGRERGRRGLGFMFKARIGRSADEHFLAVRDSSK